jgi:hypothetical protein
MATVCDMSSTSRAESLTPGSIGEDPIDGDPPAGHGRFRVNLLATRVTLGLIGRHGAIDIDTLDDRVHVPDDLGACPEGIGALGNRQ